MWYKLEFIIYKEDKMNIDTIIVVSAIVLTIWKKDPIWLLLLLLTFFI